MSLGYEGNESTDENIIRELLSLRDYLEKRIKELEEDAEKFKSLFKIVDEVITTKSFKRAEAISSNKVEETQRLDLKEEVPLKTSTGTLLATMYVGEQEARIVPDRELTFNVNTPPFQTFLIARILEPMRREDIENSQKGVIPSNQVFSYETITEDDVIRELVVKNFRERNRLREIISSARWTLEKMYENISTSENIN